MTGTRVSCPHCGASVPWTAASPWRPFCSERCRLIDLGEWFDEGHRITPSAGTDPDHLHNGFPEPWAEDADEAHFPRSSH